MVGMVSVTYVQLSQKEGFVLHHLTKSTKLCRFNTLHPFHMSTQLCSFSLINCFGCSLCNESPLFPPLFFPSAVLFVGGLPALDVEYSTYPLGFYTLPHPPIVSTIVSPSLPTQLSRIIFFQIVSSLQLPSPWISSISLITPLVWY